MLPRSILVRGEHAGRGSICFSDDPNHVADTCTIAAEYTLLPFRVSLVGDSSIVQCPVFIAHIAPVTMSVLPQEYERVLPGPAQCIDCSGRGDKLAKLQLRLFWICDGDH